MIQKQYKTSFTLMEVLIATTLLSVVMISLFQVKSNNIFILEKSEELEKQNMYLNLVMDSKEYSKRNENRYFDKLFNIKDDDIRKEFKQVKVRVKDKILDETIYDTDSISFKISQFKTTYSFEKSSSKDIYRFKLEL